MCACSKPVFGFPTTYVVVCPIFSDFMWKGILRFLDIDRRCLSCMFVLYWSYLNVCFWFKPFTNVWTFTRYYTSGLASLCNVGVTIFIYGGKWWKETINKNNSNFGTNGEIVELVLCILLDLRHCDLMFKVILFQNACE